MYQSFQTLPDSSRLWVYQSHQPLTSAQQTSISEVLTEFTSSWQVHGKPMSSSFEIRNDHFLIIAADEQVNAASGCSIDDSVRIVRKLGEQLSIDFFNRNNVAIVNDGKVELVPVSSVRRSLEERSLNENSIIINTLVQTKAELNEKWNIPLGVSWLKRFLPQASISH